MDVTSWVNRWVGITSQYSTGSSWKPCSLLVMFTFHCYNCGSWLFLSLALQSYSHVLVWMIWNCIWNIQWRWSVFILILYDLPLHRCNPMYKKIKLYIVFRPTFLHVLQYCYNCRNLPFMPTMLTWTWIPNSIQNPSSESMRLTPQQRGLRLLYYVIQYIIC